MTRVWRVVAVESNEILARSDQPSLVRTRVTFRDGTGHDIQMPWNAEGPKVGDRYEVEFREVE
jgi:hypothetical protein